MLSGRDHRIFGQLCRSCAVNSNMPAQEGPLAAGIQPRQRYVRLVAEDAKSIRERMNAKILGGAEKRRGRP